LHSRGPRKCGDPTGEACNKWRHVQPCATAPACARPARLSVLETDCANFLQMCHKRITGGCDAFTKSSVGDRVDVRREAPPTRSSASDRAIGRQLSSCSNDGELLTPEKTESPHAPRFFMPLDDARDDYGCLLHILAEWQAGHDSLSGQTDRRRIGHDDQ